MEKDVMVVRFCGRNAVPRMVVIGNEGENKVKVIRFELPQEYRNAAAFLHLVMGENSDMVNLGDKREFTPTRTYTLRRGRYDAYVELLAAGDVVWKSNVFTLRVADLPNDGEQIEQQYPTAFEEALRAAAELTAITPVAETLPAGTEATIRRDTDENGKPVLVYGIPKGDEGKPGTKGDPFTYEDFTPEQLAALKGKDGYTPQKGIDYFDGAPGYTPVKGKDYFDGKDGYTPVKGKDYFDGKDGYTPVKGKDYFDGQDGNPGADGFSPTVEVAPIEGGNRVTITDKDGEKSFDVMDGKDGEGGSGGDPVPGEDGEDGGYYIPEVSAEGDLSWTPTKADMTAVPTVNIKGEKGDKGDKGAVFTPYTTPTINSVSGAVVGYSIRWNNNGGFDNPEGVVLYHGEDGYSPEIEVYEIEGGHRVAIQTNALNIGGQKVFDIMDGTDGKDGDTPVKNKDYFDGQNGNGIKSAVLNADYTLTLTFDDGTSYTTPSIRGATGKEGSDGVGIASIKQTTTSSADGGSNVFTVTLTNGTSATFTVKNGSKGSAGTSVGIDSISESTASGGTNLVVFTDGKSLNIRNGKDGKPGDKGDPYTLTETDKAAIAEAAAGLVDVPEIVQTTGGSERAVMSQKAVTEAAGIVILPSYWEAYLPDKIAAIKALQDAGGKDCFSFVVIADPHIAQNLGKRSPAIAKRIMDACNIRYALVLGDQQDRAPKSTKAAVLTEWDEAKKMFSPIAENALFQLGNHDGSWGNPLNGTTYPYNLTPDELYNLVYAPTYKYHNAVTDESGSGYYVDDTARKVRFVMLNCHCNPYAENADGSAKYNNMSYARFTQSQYDMLIGALNTVQAGWSVVIGSHIPLIDAYAEAWGGENSEYLTMRNLLKAYKERKTYKAEWAGTAGGGDSGYTNLFDKTAPGFDDQGSKFYTNWLPYSGDDNGGNGTIYHFKGLASAPYKMNFATDANGANSTSQFYCTAANKLPPTAADYDSSVYLVQHATSEYTYCRFEVRSALPADLVITANEQIVESTGGGESGYDAVSIDADFTGAKGDLIGYFCGHIHNDYVYDAANWWGASIITTRCDSANENDSALLAERVAGTITEQSFDVFTVNRRTGKLYATKIGAGADRTITY